MEPARLLGELAELARSVGIEVRAVRPPRGEGELGAGSGTCKVRGQVWVMLADSDPVEQRIQVLAAALREGASEELEHRYLPPALRRRIEEDPDPG